MSMLHLYQSINWLRLLVDLVTESKSKINTLQLKKTNLALLINNNITKIMLLDGDGSCNVEGETN